MPAVCIYVTSFGDGGVERMLVNLAWGLASLGVKVDFIVNQKDGPYLESLPDTVRILEFKSNTRREKLAKLILYLQEARPAAVISAKGRDDIITIKAKYKTRLATRFFLRPGTAVSERLRARKTNPFKRWLTYRRLRWLFSRADGVIAVSQGVADDIINATGIDPAKVSVVRNPNITPTLYHQAEMPVDHPWFEAGQPPVFIGMGGLRRQKDFPTLLRAFAQVNRVRPSRLMILGQGHKYEALQGLAKSLGIAERVEMPGFVNNPYAYLSRAAVFVLSSRWEGSPNVLTESLAVGTPVVATDCRSGPYEITQGGKYGRLVPVGDVDALSQAMLETLDNPPDPNWLKAAVQEYTMERSARAYLVAMGLSRDIEHTNISQQTDNR